MGVRRPALHCRGNLHCGGHRRAKGPLQDSGQLLLASMTFLVTLVLTAASAFYGRVSKGPRHANFYYLQSVLDLLLVTAVVHLTRDPRTGASQFAALYILVI